MKQLIMTRREYKDGALSNWPAKTAAIFDSAFKSKLIVAAVRIERVEEDWTDTQVWENGHWVHRRIHLKTGSY